MSTVPDGIRTLVARRHRHVRRRTSVSARAVTRRSGAAIMARLREVGIAALAVGLSAAVANQAGSEVARLAAAPPAGCLVRAAVAPGYLPRAHLAVENRRAGSIRVWVEARVGLGLPRTELGRLGPFETRVFAYALPAGRNFVAADAAGEKVPKLRQVLHVSNRGPDTCTRRYLWRVE